MLVIYPETRTSHFNPGLLSFSPTISGFEGEKRLPRLCYAALDQKPLLCQTVIKCNLPNGSCKLHKTRIPKSFF